MMQMRRRQKQSLSPILAFLFSISIIIILWATATAFSRGISRSIFKTSSLRSNRPSLLCGLSLVPSTGRRLTTAFNSFNSLYKKQPIRSILSTTAMSLSSSSHTNDNFISYLNTNDAARYAIDNDSKVHLIMGNEAGDADSIISALALSYIQQQQHLKNEDIEETIVLPIVSVPRADISLRRDVMLLLDLAGITNLDDLLYIDDDLVTRHLLPSTLSTTSKATLTLVDHNRIRSSLSHLSSMVTEIVDHHEDENSHEQVVGAEKRSIAYENGVATVASTCTLITERLFQNQNNRPIDASLGLLLLGVILLDSVNMLPEAGKGTARDEEAIQLLLQHTDWTTYCDKLKTTPPSLVDETIMKKIFPNIDDGNCKPDRTALFETLSNAKNDPKLWSVLSVNDCLRIDYKRFIVPEQSSSLSVSSIGLSSVLLSMDSLLVKDNFIDDLTSYMTSSGVDLFGIMALNFQDGKPNRELLLTGNDPKIVDSFADYLLNHPDAAFLEISERSECVVDKGASSEIPHIRVFKQGNGKGSRKQVAPILLGYASTFSKL